MPRKPASTYADYIVNEYGSGRSCGDIGRKLGFSVVTISTILKRAGVEIRGNVRRIDPSLILERFDSGELPGHIASSFGVTHKVIARILASHGRSTARRLITLPTAQVIDMFNRGVGIAGIARQLNSSPIVVTRHLAIHGISPRNRGEQQAARMANLTQDQIKELTSEANKATRGRKRSTEERAKSAVTRYRNGSQRVSKYEAELMTMLQSAGLQCAQQTPIGPYNCDITTATVAVEVWGGGWHFHGEHAARCQERFSYILNAGWHIVAIVVNRSHPLTPAVADYLVGLIQQLSSDPSARRQYRVVWGAGDHITAGSSYDHQITFKPSLVDRSNRR